MPNEYKLLDSGNLQRLEQVGPYRLVRPALNAFWSPTLDKSEWKNVSGIFTRNSSGGGKWDWRERLPEAWDVTYGGLTLECKPTNFGHLGFFAEQLDNWNWLRNIVKQFSKSVDDVQVLNLFAYSGLASMAAAEGGAGVCHLDAAKGMIDWGRAIQQKNPQVPDKIRWIADDVMKFTARELRRGRSYNGIILDPPSFGRGSRGEVWKIEDDIRKLLYNCRDLLAKNQPNFILLSCHSPGFSPLVLERLLIDLLDGRGRTECGEMTITEGGGKRCLPAGCYAKLIIDE